MFCAIGLLLASTLADIPVTFYLRISGVDPSDFGSLSEVVGVFLNISQEGLALADYTEATPTHEPTEQPTDAPTDTPTSEYTDEPTEGPTQTPTQAPSSSPTQTPTESRRLLRSMEVRRRLAASDLYELVYIIYVDDIEAAEALIASVEDMDDPEMVLEEAIAGILGVDAADINANPYLIEYKDRASSEDGNKNTVAGWAIFLTLLILLLAAVFIVFHGPYYEHSETYSFYETDESSNSDRSSDEEETTTQFRIEEETTTQFRSPGERVRGFVI